MFSARTFYRKLQTTKVLDLTDNSPVMKQFAARLREAMLDKNMVARKQAASGVDVSQLKVAAGVTLEMARRYVEGTALPRPEKMTRIAAWLGVNLPWLRDGIGPKKGDPVLELTPFEHDFIRRLRQLDDSGKDFVSRSLDGEILRSTK